MTDVEESALVGLRGEPFRYVVEEGKVREIARATRSKRVEHYRATSPVAPIVATAAAQHWQPEAARVLDRLGLSMGRVLHGSQAYEFHGGSLRAGAVLTGQQRIERVYRKRGARGGEMRFIDVATEFRDESGALRVTAMSTIIETREGT